jgi:hypothetical protein
VRRATVKIRPNPAVYGEHVAPLELPGYACEIAGVPMVVHRSLSRNGLGEPVPSAKFWTITEPKTGMAAHEGERAETTTRAAAIEAAEQTVEAHGGAEAVRAEIRRHPLSEVAA